MPKKSSGGGSDPKFKAVQVIYQAISPLSSEERTQVLASVTALLDLPGPVPHPGQTPASPTTERPLALVELVQQKTPSTSAQNIALFAYYRDKVERLPHFERDDLRQYFAKAKIPPPTNYDRDFVEAVKKGWLHENGSDSYITNKGIAVVESAFAGARSAASLKRRGRKRAMKRKSGASSRKSRPRKG
jgi:hypothetical protein